MDRFISLMLYAEPRYVDSADLFTAAKAAIDHCPARDNLRLVLAVRPLII